MLCYKYSLLNLTSQHMARSLVVVWMALRRKVVLGVMRQICKIPALKYLGECKFACTSSCQLVFSCYVPQHLFIYCCMFCTTSYFIYISSTNSLWLWCKELYCVGMWAFSVVLISSSLLLALDWYMECTSATTFSLLSPLLLSLGNGLRCALKSTAS